MFQFNLAELALVLAVALSIYTATISFMRRQIAKRNRIILALEKEVSWEKLQNQMIISEVQTFKDASNQLREKAMDLAVQLSAKKENEEEEFLDDIRNDLLRNDHLN